LNPEFKVLRLFVAIALPEEVKAMLSGVQNELKKVLPLNTTAWTRPESLHLTLRFLGGVEAVRVPQLEHRLRENVAGFGELELICEQLGCFPGLRSPRVVWTWVHDSGERLATLQQRVEGAVGEFADKPADNRFIGHVTLCRPKRIRRTEAERLAQFVESAADRRFGVWTCREVELIRSDLSSSGSHYTTLAHVPL
jgi:RNA 2',3'-cyclic 3'-phosphodiesterase